MKRMFVMVVNELWFRYNLWFRNLLAEDLIASDQPTIPPLSLDDYGDF